MLDNIGAIKASAVETAPLKAVLLVFIPFYHSHATHFRESRYLVGIITATSEIKTQKQLVPLMEPEKVNLRKTVESPKTFQIIEDGKVIKVV